MIYLAGAIDKTYEIYCRQWRKLFYKFEVIDPIKDKDLNDTYSVDYIYETDMESVKTCDLIVAELMLNTPYIGTSMELQEAHMTFKDIILITNKDHYFLNYIINYSPAGDKPKGMLREKVNNFKDALKLVKIWQNEKNT